MVVYNLQDRDWEKVKEFWENDILDEYKDQTVFQMESFPKHKTKSITFISYIPEVVEDVSKKFGLNENKYWTSIGTHGLKRLTGLNSPWNDIPLKKVIEYTPMSKQQLVNALNLLDNRYKDFSNEHLKASNVKDKFERENAESNVRIIIEQTKKYIRQNEELYQILTDGETSDFGRANIMDEFSTARFFDYDLQNLINKLKRKIEQM